MDKCEDCKWFDPDPDFWIDVDHGDGYCNCDSRETFRDEWCAEFEEK